MRLLTLAAAAALSLSVNAFELSITGFSGQYDAPNGQGTATQFSLPAQDKELISISVEARGEGYVLTTPEGEWEWSEPSDWVKDLKTASWSNVDVVVGATSQRAAIGSLDGVHEDKRIVIHNLDASCSGAAELIESCLNGTGSIRLRKVQYVSALRHDTFSDILRALTRALELPTRSDTTVEDLKLDIRSNKFKGEVSIDAGISATVKFEGLVSYSKVEGKTSIRLDKAKALFLDVRGKIFDELEKIQSDTLVVERPWIHILSE